MTLLVTGSTGILGRAVVTRAGELGIAFTATFHRRPDADGAIRLDITRERDVFDLFERLRPRTVVNCAGLTKNLCTDDALAWNVNAVAPRLLMAASERVGARLVHVSTDCVFRGADGPYDERSAPDAEDVYGRSKLAGETAEHTHLTVRTSFIGPEAGTRNGLLAWFLSQKGEVTGFTNHLWSGLTARELADGLLHLAERPEVTGLAHVHGEDTTKADLLRLLKDAYATDVEIVDSETRPGVDRRLRSVREGELGLAVPPLARMIEEMAEADAATDRLAAARPAGSRVGGR
jgi:dTDP-4-dehydrorhamnose reductase